MKFDEQKIKRTSTMEKLKIINPPPYANNTQSQIIAQFFAEKAKHEFVNVIHRALIRSECCQSSLE